MDRTESVGSLGPGESSALGDWRELTPEAAAASLFNYKHRAQIETAVAELCRLPWPEPSLVRHVVGVMLERVRLAELDEPLTSRADLERRKPVGRKYPHEARRFGRLIITTVMQGTTRRLVDEAWVEDREGNRYRGRAIHLRPWRRNRWGEILAGTALVIGWRQ